MKKSILTFAFIIGISLVSFGQKNLVSLGTGMNYHSNEGSAMYFIPIELSYQRAISENITIGIGSTYAIGLNKVGGSSTSINCFTPKFDYYFKSAFEGMHIGTNVSVNNYNVSTESNGISVTASQMAATLGARLGYSFKLSTNWVADISLNPGYDLLFNGGKGSFTNKTMFSLGYNF